jgi:hypothetical protein
MLIVFFSVNLVKLLFGKLDFSKFFLRGSSCGPLVTCYLSLEAKLFRENKFSKHNEERALVQ